MSRDFLNPDEMADAAGYFEESQQLDNLTLNLDDVSEDLPKFEAMPPGVYDAIIDNVEFGPSKNSGNPMLTFTFRIMDPQYEGRLQFYHTVLNKESGLSRLKRLLVRVCSDIDLGEFNPRKFADEGEALGLPCRVKINVKAYQGSKRNNITDVLAPDESAVGYLDVE